MRCGAFRCRDFMWFRREELYTFGAVLPQLRGVLALGRGDDAYAMKRAVHVCFIVDGLLCTRLGESRRGGLVRERGIVKVMHVAIVIEGRF